MIDACAGRVRGTALAAFVKRTPSVANESMFGVSTFFEP